MIDFSSWGRLYKAPHCLYAPAHRFSSLPSVTDDYTGGKLLPRGNGRSYGDACLNSSGTLIWSVFLDSILDIDPAAGTVRVEAGVLLRDLQRLLVTRGFMLPVTPGTQEITVGGAIASDVHCKNHHRFGTFGCHVLSFTLLRSDGQILECSPDSNSGYFRATIGGMGLTGFVTEATLKLRKVSGSLIRAEYHKFASLDEFCVLARDSEKDYEHTVAWTDCISGSGGRGIFMRGNHEDEPKVRFAGRSLGFPFTPPVSLVNGLSLRMFNEVYYWLNSRKSKPFLINYDKFFYPLDAVTNWNRIYGPRGFYQYQCVVPGKDGMQAVREIQKLISRSGEGSFLGVLKTFGDMKSPGILSFPMPGFTYALDFPNRGAKTAKLFADLDAVVRNAGGRLYLAKDARQPRELFEAGYGSSLEEFVRYVDPGFSSDLSRRLMGF